MKRGFGSDNHAPVHPQVLQFLTHVNDGHQPSYGTDPWTAQAIEKFKIAFGSQAEVFFVFNGTACNVSALRALVRPYQAVFCTDVSHLQNDECGAPEFFAGCKLITVPAQNGKLRVEDLERAFIRRGDQHHSQIQALSLTQPTELGTVYSIQEMKDLIAWAQSKKLYVHIDGARLSNAAFFLKKSFQEITTDLGVDIVSFGGTKNGLMMGEAVVILNPHLAKDFQYIRKQSGQLPSKSRYIAAQFLAYFEQDLWEGIAAHGHDMAQLLYQQSLSIPGVEITQTPQSNAVFARIPQSWIKKLRQDYFFYVWDEATFECRWMTSWDTQPEDIYGFVKKLKELSNEIPSRSLS
jgi:threonine aldolase